MSSIISSSVQVGELATQSEEKQKEKTMKALIESLANERVIEAVQQSFEESYLAKATKTLSSAYLLNRFNESNFHHVPIQNLSINKQKNVASYIRKVVKSLSVDVPQSYWSLKNHFFVGFTPPIQAFFVI